MAARTGARTGLSPPAPASDSGAYIQSATEGTTRGRRGGSEAGLDLSFAGSQEEYHCMWRCPRPGLNPSGLVNNSSLATGPQFTEMKIL